MVVAHSFVVEEDCTRAAAVDEWEGNKLVAVEVGSKLAAVVVDSKLVAEAGSAVVDLAGLRGILGIDLDL